MIWVTVWWQTGFCSFLGEDRLVALDGPLVDLRTLFPGCHCVELSEVVR